MSNILYYSNYCNNCKNVLTTLAKSKLKEELFYLCVDKRKKGHDGATYLVLETGQELLLPPTVTKVPALLLINYGHRVLFGDEIYNHFRHKDTQNNNVATMNNGEPSAFSLGSMNGSGVISDNYSFWDMSSDDLSAKGSGGLKQMYNYAVPETNSSTIETPPDTYVPDKIGSDVSLDSLTQSREQDLNK